MHSTIYFIVFCCCICFFFIIIRAHATHFGCGTKRWKQAEEKEERKVEAADDDNQAQVPSGKWQVAEDVGAFFTTHFY